MPETTSTPPSPAATQRFVRPDEGRRLAGVCAAIAAGTRQRVGVVRAAFLLGILLLGFSVVVYLACWLVIPAERSTEGERASTLSSAIVGVVLVCGGLLALAALALLSAAATLFGFGWGVVLVGAGMLGAGALWLRQVSPAWMLLPVIALVAPATVVSSGHTRLSGHIGDITARPSQLSELPAAGYHTALGTLFIDLRQTQWPSSGTVQLHVRAGLGKTVVALPHTRCVTVSVDYDVHSSVVRSIAKSLVSLPSSSVNVFGDAVSGGRGSVATSAHAKAPRLVIHFASEGGPLYVRDYPMDVFPNDYTGWPGPQLPLDSRPSTAGLSKSDARTELADWREEVKQQRLTNTEIPGPCANGSSK